MIQLTTKRITHGGKRKNAGRKPVYSEPTIVVSFRCPKSKKKELTTEVNKILRSYLR